MNAQVDQYLIDGCGRCSLYKTPQCKVHKWHSELQLLRSLMLQSNLTEQLKWKQPCYTYQGKNIAIISAFNDNCVISFLKGSLINDTESILEFPGKNSQAAKFARFSNLKEITTHQATIKQYIQQAIAIEKEGRKIAFKSIDQHHMPHELQQAMKNDSVFKHAFLALTPGKQRGYILHFAQPTLSQTRTSRIEKCKPAILQGKGIHDDYKNKLKK